MGPKMEDMLLTLGRPGRYQTLVICVLAWAYAYVTAVHFSFQVVGVVPPHSCKLPSNWTFEDKNQSVAFQEVQVSDQCNVFVDPQNHSLGLQPCPHGFQFEPEQDGRPEFVSEWSLVCERLSMVRVLQCTHIVGLILGGLLVGLVCDKYGRFITFIAAIVIEVIIILVIYFAKSYVAIVLLSFARAIFIQFLQVSAFVLCMEIAVEDTRVRAAVLVTTTAMLGNLWAAAMAQANSNWRNYFLALASPAILPLIAAWGLPESLRFLLANQKVPKAVNVVDKICKLNGNKIPEDITMHMKAISDDIKKSAGFTKGQSLLALVQKKQLRTSLIQIIPIVVAVHMSQWIPAMTLKSLGSGFFINVYVTSMVEFVARLVVYLPVIKLGRRISLVSSAGIVAITALICALVAAVIAEPGTMRILSSISAMLMVVGFGGFATTFNLYVCELFPTTQRSTVFGLTIALGQIGAIIIPEIESMGDTVWSHFPHIFCGTLTLLASALAFFLPETKDQPLQDAICHKYKTQGEIANNGDENESSIPLKLVPKLSNAK